MDTIIYNDHFGYTRLVLFSWFSEPTPTSISGLYSDKLINEVKGKPYSYSDLIVLNCNDISNIDTRHGLEPILTYFNENNKCVILFSNDNKHKVINSFKEIFNYRTLNNNMFFVEGDSPAFCIGNGDYSKDRVIQIINEALDFESKTLHQSVSNTYKKYKDKDGNDIKKRLSSSSMEAEGEFNATDILSDPVKYKWFIALLAESVNRVIQLEKPPSYTIIAASLRGAAIAGAVWELLYFVSNPDLYIIDHIGPRYDLLEIPSKDHGISNVYCIYIGDFLITGTEVKVANSFCNFYGSTIKHAFVIGKYLNEEPISMNIRLHSLVKLEECIPDLSYSI